MSAPFVIVTLSTGTPLVWAGRFWSWNLDIAEEYETRAEADRQMARLGAPERVVVIRSTAKRMFARASEKESTDK